MGTSIADLGAESARQHRDFGAGYLIVCDRLVRIYVAAGIASSPGPAASGPMSSRRRVRPGRASLGRNMDPISPAAPVMTTTDTRSPPLSGSAG